MQSADQPRKSPPFTESWEGASLQIPPPFTFQGVSARVFPLRANMARLVHYCNQFINAGVPGEIVYVRPAMPIVFMQVIHYGKMAVDTDNFGWFSQNEFVFSIPVERYRLENGKPRFEGWALLNPFIFVDKDSSEIIGREIYGWPKVHGWLEADVSSWIEDPRADRRMATFNTMVYPDVYAGRSLEPRSLVEVFEKAPPGFSQIPPDPHGALNPFHVLPKAAAGFWEILQTFWQNVANLSTGTATVWLNNYPVKGIQPIANAWQDLRKYAAVVPKLLPINTENHYSLMTLKQFRDAEDPRFACYQAVISSEMYLNQFNAGGMLGDMHLALGDVTGGYYLKIREYPSQPIVQSLGLVAASRTIGADGVATAIFEPVLPFWMNVDISYDKGDIVCSQTRWSTWERGNHPEHLPTVDQAPSPVAAGHRPLSIDELQDSHTYNNARGEASEEMIGPFSFPNATIRVLPLMADKAVLQAFVDRSMNHAEQEFEVAGSMVYLTITNFDEMSSATNDIGRWAHREVRFAVPVRWFDCRGGERKLMGMALVSPFVYLDTDTAMNTLREVYGEPAALASIDCPPGAWLDVDGPARGAPLLELTSNVLPAMFAGAEMTDRLLLSVVGADALDQFDHAGWNRIAADWGAELVSDLESKWRRAAADPGALGSMKALALELLVNGEAFNQVSFKQFRDAHDVGSACYQALVSTRTTVDHLWDIREIEERMHVCIHDYPSQPIVSELGLKVKWRSDTDKVQQAWLQPLRPFWLKVSMTTGVSENVAQRAGSAAWRFKESWFGNGYLSRPGRCGVGPELARSIDAVTRFARAPESSGVAAAPAAPPDRLDPGALAPRYAADPGGEGIWKHFLDRRGRNHYLELAVRDWRAHAADDDLLNKGEVADLLTAGVIDPQMAIDSILAHEWSHWGNPRFYRHGVLKDPVTQLPEFCVRRDSVGTAAVDLFPARDSMEVASGGWYPKIGSEPR